MCHGARRVPRAEQGLRSAGPWCLPLPVAARVYLDYNATAPLRPEVRRAIEPLLFADPEDGRFGNPSSIHWAGQAARKALETARAKVAAMFSRRPSEVIFTSGGTEANNLAVFGVARRGRGPARPARLLVSAVEHPAVLAPARALEAEGVVVEYLPVTTDGQLDLDALDRALLEPASLISVMAVNNETGVISPIEEVIRRARAKGVVVHVDAVQAIGRIDARRLDGAELLTISGHKLGAQKGCGVLLARAELPISPLLHGGPQERGHRAGTEDVAAATGLSVALELAIAEREEESARLGALRARLDASLAAIEGARILGAGAPRVASTTTVVFGGVDGDVLLQALDLEGIAASSGSACSSGSLEPSHVLIAMGVPPREALSAVRFSLGHGSTAADVERVLAVLPALVARVRAAT